MYRAALSSLAAQAQWHLDLGFASVAAPSCSAASALSFDEHSAVSSKPNVEFCFPLIILSESQKS
ncbi:hypothetical protein L248_2975 [Schleiferilactobacillus shenzhenensis LY-73]|uniref:Uncharacterized protein n=1 Tax=Schleiferilactobacillus shenzhenensis LY-73 TaxID=1231336 RepID=U4TUC1_9LACO|nr:hypothetical protein L248_2975 [Schleiferilactobacillus shenzhenensis LY-73]